MSTTASSRRRQPQHAEVATEATEPERPAVEDELAARRRAVAGRWAVELVDVTAAALAEDDDSGPALRSGGEANSPLRQAEDELAAAEAAHWQSEFDLADAEGRWRPPSTRWTRSTPSG